MSSGIVKYEPLHIVNLFNGKKYYIKSSNLNVMLEKMQTSKFITIRDTIINSSSIDYIEPATEDINQIENKLIGINREKSERIRQEVYLRKTNNPHKILSDGVLENIKNKFTS